MVHWADLLGMNARVQLYTAQNQPEAKKYGFSKLRAKAFLRKHNIGVAELYAQIASTEELRHWQWSAIKGSFAVKPASGSAGKGIVVIDRYDKRHREWIDVTGKHFSADDLNLHVSDILAGQYSTWGTKYKAIIEERIPIHPNLADYVQLGTPDIRVIVYHNIPVMAMVRLPTVASAGRANLDQGAIALGIDLASGKTTFAVSGKKKTIRVFPHTQQPVGGIQIPNWNDVLRTAVRTANATGLAYMGADIFLHPDRGPLVAEVNAYPGLSIQLANHDGLRRRLLRLEGIQARNVGHAVKISQALFGSIFPLIGADDVERPVVNTKEEIMVFGDDDRHLATRALLNTGRYRSVIALNIAHELGLNDPQDLLWNQKDELEEKAPVVPVTFRLKERKIVTSMIVSARLNNKRYPVELGRHDLAGFLLNAEET